MQVLIQEIFSKNPDFTYQQIADAAGCAKSTVCYYLGKNQRTKSNHRQRAKRGLDHPFQKKLECFRESTKDCKKRPISSTLERQLYNKLGKYTSSQRGITMKPTIALEDVINKFGENPKCYLTGQPIDIYQPSTYHFDHKIPRTRGGDNSLANMGICTKQANYAKRDMTPEEFIAFCKSVVSHSSV